MSKYMIPLITPSNEYRSYTEVQIEKYEINVNNHKLGCLTRVRG